MPAVVHAAVAATTEAVMADHELGVLLGRQLLLQVRLALREDRRHLLTIAGQLIGQLRQAAAVRLRVGQLLLQRLPRLF